MLRVPTSRKRKRPETKLNLVPIMDSVFIFIFFLLMSASFMNIYEIESPIPLLSETDPLESTGTPLALTMTIDANQITLSSGIPARSMQRFNRQLNGQFDLENLHKALIEIKKQNVNEDSIILEPVGDLTYEEIVKIMDSVRTLQKTDEAIFRKNKNGIEEKINVLFNKIMFGNLMT